jgi:hypothetical protein
MKPNERTDIWFALYSDLCQSLSIQFYGLINGVIIQYFSTCGSVSLNDLEIKKNTEKISPTVKFVSNIHFISSAAPTQVWKVS